MSGAVFLIVDARVRYWEDAEINGVADEAGVLIPLREGDSWRPVIELATGKILGWPQGTTADIHFKVCDDGDYWLADSEGGKIAKWRGDYVPDKFLLLLADPENTEWETLFPIPPATIYTNRDRVSLGNVTTGGGLEGIAISKEGGK